MLSGGEAGVIATFAMLVPALINAMFYGFGIMACRSTVARARARRLLAGVAGSLLLWCGVYHWLAWSERHWAGRDTAVIPTILNGRVTISPFEARIVDRYREHVAAILAEEAGN